MTNGTIPAPSAIQGDTFNYPSYGGVPLQLAIPYMMSAPSYTDLPFYWSWARDVVLCASVHREDMWASAVGRTATKFAAHSFTVKDSKDSQLRVKNSQALMKTADGGQGWVTFAEKVMQDLLLCDNGIFIRVRRADDKSERVKLKAAFSYQEQMFDEAVLTSSSPAAKITGLYHLDSLRCSRTGNLAFPVRYQPVMGAPQLLRWDQVLTYADMPSSRAELFGVGMCAASRAYHTISTLAGLRQMLHEFVTGKGANKLSFLQGISEPTLKGVIRAGEVDAQAKGLVYYLGTILGAIPGDTPLSLIEVILKSLPQGFDVKQVIDDAYLIYANAIGIPVQDIKPLSGQGLGTGTQSVILQEQSQGIGIAAFLKWWEQTFSDRIFPATTELSFDNEHDTRDKQAIAQARQVRGADRAQRVQSGEISPAIARQIAADDGDLPQELLAQDVTPGGQISDDEKPEAQSGGPVADQLIASEPTSVPARQTVSERGNIPGQAPVTKSEWLATAKSWADAVLLDVDGWTDDEIISEYNAAIRYNAQRQRYDATKSYDALYASELEIARKLARIASD